MSPTHPIGVPSHLPPRLTITLWDFSWYTMASTHEPFHDLDAAFDEAVARGYNTVRICAMPYLLFGEHGIDTTALPFASMGDGVGFGTRWYDVTGGVVLDGRRRLTDLFEAARRHDCFVVLSSWEYQQSPAFLAGREWYDALAAVPVTARHHVMATAMADLVQYLKDHDLADRIAYAELHNEVDLSRIKDVDGSDGGAYWPQRPFVSDAVELMQQRHPDVLATACYGIPPHLDMGSVPDNGQVGHFHIYVYGVLAALEQWAGVRQPPPAFPSRNLQDLMRHDAPAFEDYVKRTEPWRLEATGVSASMFYSYDWIDTARWDRWLYENYGQWREAMRQALDDRLTVLAQWSDSHSVPLVIGEGWIGYTPLHAEFEDGPVGQGLAEDAVRRCIEVGAWGTVLGSNSAPHHPGWQNVPWQQRWNREFLGS
ncbi:cellulase-like family protein [Terrabacter sp. GCM10028922]|uniref:cellulase-like family protein n=1 Tax=Terrabacter sp. GCM10028922 TaxID=3273428 RepID=UPI00361A33D3